MLAQMLVENHFWFLMEGSHWPTDGDYDNYGFNLL